jgi:hypothetical protein
MGNIPENGNFIGKSMMINHQMYEDIFSDKPTFIMPTFFPLIAIFGASIFGPT